MFLEYFHMLINKFTLVIIFYQHLILVVVQKYVSFLQIWGKTAWNG